MATTFKTLINSDIATTRTLLHEAIPITGTIASGTYKEGTSETNIKTFAHGMFEGVFDYPFLSSSANHIFDISAGYSAQSALSAAESTRVQQAKKINIYNQHAQVLVGYDIDGNIQEFDQDGNIAGGGNKMREVFFINFARLLTKDEIKKDSFRLKLYATASSISASLDRAGMETIGDYDAATEYKVNSPAGEYGLLYTASAGKVADGGEIVGHVYYQAGIAVITASYFTGAFGDPEQFAGLLNDRTDVNPEALPQGRQQVDNAFTGSTITQLANGLRYTIDNIDFNNTTELNSTIYFCRANTQDYNYSSNPTYLNGSKIRVKNDNPQQEPSAYITTVGLYSADNELLAVAKLSEPLKKTPANELTLRVRLDY